MRQWKVRDVMTNEVLTVPAEARPREVISKITGHDVSALAVVDEFDVVIGVLTRTDILEAMAWREERPRSRLVSWRRARPEVGWRRSSAREMMTAPAVTVAPDVTPAQAGRLMVDAGVKRLLVTDDRRRLLGIVAAADLLKIFARSDEAVMGDVRSVLTPLAVGAVHADVHAGVVSLTGRVPDRAAEHLLRDVARGVPGVVDVVTDLHVESPAVAGNGSGRPAERSRRAIDGWWAARNHRRTASERLPGRNR
jgi:CBS-domain-containing membrane protein